MTSKNHKKVCTTLNYIEHLLVLASAVTGCVSISASLVSIPIGNASSPVGSKICAITTEIKKYSSTIMKKKKHNKIVLLAKNKSNTIEVLTSRALINSYIRHGEFVLANIVLR